jgi:hypothetical protein
MEQFRVVVSGKEHNFATNTQQFAHRREEFGAPMCDRDALQSPPDEFGCARHVEHWWAGFDLEEIEDVASEDKCSIHTNMGTH